MYAGEVVESGSVREIFHQPRHPYTQKLLECDPARIPERTRELPIIAGGLPDLVALPTGCVFRERCDRAVPSCAVRRPELLGSSHKTACHVVEMDE
jgi:oligopeptide/dipeptide ABC transporter ATP-binding protein